MYRSRNRNKRASLHIINVGAVKRTYDKYIFLLWFYIGIIAGTFLINICSGEFYDKIGVYSSFFLDMNKNIRISENELFFYIIKKLSLEIIAFIILLNSKLKEVASRIFVCYKGVTVALLSSAYVMKYGIGGVLIYLMTIFPHCIPYIYMIVILLKADSSRNKALTYLQVIILFFLTAFTEAYINSQILHLIE